VVKKFTKQQIIDWAMDRGWKLDKWGHLQKKIGDKEYRFKLSNTAMRYEVKIHYPETIMPSTGMVFGRASSGWLRLRSGYYKDLYITSEGKLSGLK